MSPTAPLLDSKFQAAVSAAEIIERNRLDLPASFLQGVTKVATLTGPAGYGKSTILSRWQQQLGESDIEVAWLNLDESDNDPARFIRYVGYALFGDKGTNDIDMPVSDNPGDSELPELQVLAARLADTETRKCLVLDDVHVLSNQQSLDALHWLTHYAPDHIQFLLSGRALTHIRLSRLRVRRKLVSVSQDDLKFTSAEVSSFLATRGITLSSQDCQTLIDQTEGWPAGLELAAILLEDHSDPHALIAEFHGNEDNVIDYLGDVLLDRLDADTRSFMFKIAQFRRINASLAEHATGTEDCAQKLDALHRGNVFLCRLKGPGDWYRFHELIRDYLSQQGQQDDPQGCSDALRLGADYFYEQQQVFEAINCAVRAKAWDKAAQWLATHIEDLTLNQGYLQSTLDWIQQLPTEWTNRYPSIRLQYAFSLTFFGRHRDSAEHLQQLEMTLESWRQNPDTDPKILEQLERDLSAQRIYYFGLCDDRKQALEEAEAWLQRWPEAGGDQKCGISNVLTYAYNAYGRYDDAKRLSDEMLRWIPAHGVGHFVYSWSYLMRCVVLLKSGDYKGVQQVADEALSNIPRHTTRSNWLNKGSLHDFLAFAHYEFGDLEAAEKHMEAALAQADDYSFADQHIVHHLTLARLQRRRGETAEGIHLLEKGRSISESQNMLRPALSLAAEQVAWHIRDGETERGITLAARYGLDKVPSSKDYDLNTDKCLRTSALCHMQDEPQAVLAALEAGIAHSRGRARDHRLVELLLLQSMVLQSISELDSAVASASEAIALSAKRGYFQVLRDDGASLASLYQRIKLPRDADDATQALLKRLLQSGAASAGGTNGDSNQGLIEPLTKRELQILSRLASDLSNREIAEAIFISEGTLKWHLHNIYGKLCVHTRSGAVEEARKLQLI